MQISKTVITFSLLAACAVPNLFADTNSAAPATILRPNDEQIARAREAVRSKIAELNAQEPAAPTPAVEAQPAPVTKPQAEPVLVIKPAPAKPAKAAKAPKPAPAPKPTPARKPVPEPRTVAAPETATPAVMTATSQPVVAPAKTGFSPIPNNPGLAPDQDEKLRESVRQAISAANAQDQAAHIDTSTVAAYPIALGAAPSSKAHPAPAPASFSPIAPPASPLTGSKEARLAELLIQYKADTITPEHYHTERAKILAEP